jgi:hypothetical protein
MKEYAIAHSNVPYAKILAREKNINATFVPAPYGRGETMVTDMTRGQFKRFLQEVLLLRSREERKVSCPILAKEDILSGGISVLKMRTLKDGRRATCFRTKENFA